MPDPYPFFWPELEDIGDVDALSSHAHILQTLPDGGWDAIFSRRVQQHCAREGLPLPTIPHVGMDQESDSATCRSTKTPNALSAPTIAVRPDRRRTGLVETMIEAMKQVAREQGLRVLVVHLRPTRKSDYPWMAMED